MKNYDITKMKDSFYTYLVILFTVGSLFKTSYSTPINLSFGGYDSHSDIALILEPNNEYQTTSPFNFKNDYKIINNYASYHHDTKVRHFLNLKLNKFLFPHHISEKYKHPIFLKNYLMNKTLSNLQIYQNDPLCLIS